MNELITIKNQNYIFSDISISKETYVSKEFKFINSTFSLFEALQDLVEYGANKKTSAVVGTDAQWYAFLKKYYNHYNSLRNVFKDYISGQKLNSHDIDIIRNAYSWVAIFLCSAYRDDPESNSIPHLMNALLAGRFYNRLFYVLKSNETTIEEFLGIEDGKEEQVYVIELVQKEHCLNRELEEELLNSLVKLSETDKEKQLQLYGMWHRTVDFVKDNLSKMDDEIPFK